MIRSPHAKRPWQHVLDCLSGYLLLGQRLLQGDATCARAWNFGPAVTDNREVVEVLQSMRKSWPALSWQPDNESHPHETGLLHLDSTRAHEALSWRPVWTLDEALHHTADWYRLHAQDGAPISAGQLLDFLATAQQRNVVWTR
jgi:CDP-glucose 4,6-dehydratase